jgi:hypothetical protein
MNKRLMNVAVGLAFLVPLAACQSKLDKEYKDAQKKQEYYNSPEFKAKQKAIMQEGGPGGYEDALKKYQKSMHDHEAKEAASDSGKQKTQ